MLVAHRPAQGEWQGDFALSLLHNPDRDLAAYSRTGQVDVRRVAWVIANLRPMRAAQRDALVDALPEWKPALR